MDTPSKPPFHIVTQLVDRLVRGEYSQVLLSAPSSRMSARELEAAVVEYGRRLVSPPHYELVNVLRVASAERPTWSLVVPLFTEEEGRSDLSLELTVSESEKGCYEISVDDLHAL